MPETARGSLEPLQPHDQTTTAPNHPLATLGDYAKLHVDGGQLSQKAHRAKHPCQELVSGGR
eukprot:442572-Alexandrium_andersonii.AAC.1